MSQLIDVCVVIARVEMGAEVDGVDAPYATTQVVKIDFEESRLGEFKRMLESFSL